eukprot:g966.t1
MSKTSRCTLQCVRGVVEKQWALLTLLSMAGAAAINSSFGNRVYKPATKVLVTALFAILGLTLDLTELRGGITALHVHLPLQLFSLVFTPLLYYCLVYRWRWEVRSGILNSGLATGAMAAMTMSTTTNTSVLFTQQAWGDVAVAVVNAAVGNLLGAVISPIMSMALIGGQQAHQDVRAVLLKLCEEITFPLVAGLTVQTIAKFLVRRAERGEHGHGGDPKAGSRNDDSISAPFLSGGSSNSKAEQCRGAAAGKAAPQTKALRRVARIFQTALKWLEKAILVMLFYLIFAKAFYRKPGKKTSISARGVAALVVWITALHLLLLALAWLVSRALGAHGGMTPKQRVAFILVAPQKTEGMAIAILTIIFADVGSADMALLTLPVVVYHSVQMLVAMALLPSLRRLKEGTRSATEAAAARPAAMAAAAGCCPRSATEVAAAVA